jgi:hypothetical protein
MTTTNATLPRTARKTLPLSWQELSRNQQTDACLYVEALAASARTRPLTVAKLRKRSLLSLQMIADYIRANFPQELDVVPSRLPDTFYIGRFGS